MKLPIFAILLMTGCALAQAPPERMPPSIRTVGEATVKARPDQARIEIGVVTQASTAQAAGSQNATRADAVLRELRGIAGPKAEIRTTNYTLEPNYRAPKPGGAPEIAGYTARNTVEVVTADLPAVGKLIDGAMQAGANNIQRLEYTLKDRAAAHAQALGEAATKARADAAVIANALGVTILRVLSADAGAETPVRPMMMMARMEAAPTPVEPGTVDVHAVVTLQVEVSR